MAVRHGYGKIVTDGLVLALDAADRNSYPGSGTTWYDISGNGNDGTLTNGPTFDSGNAGSIVFDGVDDYVGIGESNSIIGDNQSNISIIQYINLEDFTRRYTFSLKRNNISSGNSTFISLEHNFTLNTIGVLYQTPVGIYRLTQGWSSLNTWVYIATTTTSSVSKLYVNGIPVSTGNGVGIGYSGNNGPLVVGSFDSSQLYFRGKVGPTLLYTKTLSDSEILQNYNATKSRFGL